MFSDDTKEDKEAFAALSDSYSSLFRDTRNYFIDGHLKSVYDEHNGQQHDFIDDLLKKKKKIDIGNDKKKKLKCGAENESSKRKCTNCKGHLVTEGINFSDFYIKSDKQYPYENFSSVEINQNFIVKTGEPDLINRARFENISSILFSIAERAGIQQNNEAHQWLFLECDGGISFVI